MPGSQSRCQCCGSETLWYGSGSRFGSESRSESCCGFCSFRQCLMMEPDPDLYKINDGSGSGGSEHFWVRPDPQRRKMRKLNSNSDICVRWVGEEPRPCLDGELCEECAHHEFPRLDVRLYVDCGGKPGQNGNNNNRFNKNVNKYS
jgi:hypothetical protein